MVVAEGRQLSDAHRVSFFLQLPLQSLISNNRKEIIMLFQEHNFALFFGLVTPSALLLAWLIKM